MLRSAPRIEVDQRSREARLRLERVERLIARRRSPRTLRSIPVAAARRSTRAEHHPEVFGDSCLRDGLRFAHDSPLEGSGFELLVPFSTEILLLRRAASSTDQM